MICLLHPDHWLPLLPFVPVLWAALRRAPRNPAESARPHVTGNAPAGDR